MERKDEDECLSKWLKSVLTKWTPGVKAAPWGGQHPVEMSNDDELPQCAFRT